MSHSYIKIWIHLVFSTKDREPMILESFEKQLHNHIKTKLIEEFECYFEEINGTKDHIHMLFQISPNFSLQNIIKNIKGESSHWINQKNFLKRKFLWQTGYSAFSISVDKVEIVRKYIQEQKSHHKKLTFSEELEKFLKIYGFKDK
ncbi:MAG: IS200/IS605 family transposase [Ignavibacteria bacterium]|nr:IS200/IS605 family transposase [Ignavibacteria bacterium]